MKKCLIIVIFAILLLNSINIYTAHADTNNNYDNTINEIIDGIDETTFNFLTDFFNELFNDNKSFKERVISFFNGELNLSFSTVSKYLLSGVNSVFNNFAKLLCYILFLGILCNIANIILCKNNDNTEKNIIFYICYTLAILVISQIIFTVFNFTTSVIKTINETIQIVFPIMFSLSSLIGDFGVTLFKPFTAFIGVFTSVITNDLFIPLLTLSSSTVIVGNLSDSINLNNLSKSLFSFFKWTLGIFIVIFTALIGSQGFVNMQFNGASVKILKYATGSLVPVVGGFLSGGVDILLSSTVLVKNSIGLMAILYLIFYVGGAGISILIYSFLLKFGISVCGPIIDKKFSASLLQITDIFNLLASLVFICGFIFILTILAIIGATATII